MGSTFRTMLAPIDRSTGDSRRFATGSVTLAPTPFPFEWVREREGAHVGAVSIGRITEAGVMSVGLALDQGYISEEAVRKLGLNHSDEGVFGKGEMFDDADRETMPELAEDVATALFLASNGTLGPSVDPDTFEGVPVIVGTDTPVTWDMIEAAELAGEELKLELLITSARVRAATLVSIPAFVETTAPLEILEPVTSDVATIVASIAPAGWTPDATLFEPPEEALTERLDITWDYAKGQVYGLVAPWGVCHVGIQGECITAPHDPNEGAYAWFHRHPVETDDGGLVWAGRLTVGGNHAPLNLTASQAMAQYDTKTVAAYVMAREVDNGILVCGPINPELTAAHKSVLARRKVSGDWRETSGAMTLVEVLALPPGPRHLSEPGFPVVATHVRNGRQTTLVAAFGAGLPETTPSPSPFSVAAIREAVRAEAERERARVALATMFEADQEADAAEARAALVAEFGGEDGD